MSIKGMSPIHNYNDNNLGIKLNDYIKLQREYKQEYNVKFTLPKRDTFFSTDKLIGLPFTYRSAETFNGENLAVSNISKPTNTKYKTSSIEGSNQIDFRSGEWIKLGEYNGVNVRLRENKYGQVDSNLGVPIELESKPAEFIKEYQEKALEMYRKMSDSQREEIVDISIAFNNFAKVASDENAILNVCDEDHKHLIVGLEKMGVDLSKPFAINGEEFYLRNDTGKIDYYNKKKYVLNSEGKVEIKDAKNENPSDVWKDLSKQIDIHEASFDELEDVAMRLYNEGQISGFDCAILTFNPNASSQVLKPDIFLTHSNSDGKRDWIAEFKARSERDLRTNNLQRYEYNQNALAILNKLL